MRDYLMKDGEINQDLEKRTAKLTETTPAEVFSCKKSDNKQPKTKTLHQKTQKPSSKNICKKQKRKQLQQST